MRFTFVRTAAAVILAGIIAGVALQAQRVPSAGGSFLPSADYDLSGDVRFTNPGTASTSPVTLGATQTLTNKTLTSPTITGATVTGSLASPTITGTVAGAATYTTPTFPTGGAIFTNATSGSITLSPPTGALGTVTLSLPAATDTLVGKATTDTLTNKTLTAPIVSSLSNTGTVTLPNATGAVPVVLYCGSTGSGNQTCSPAAAAATTKIYAGHSTLASNAAVITFSPAFASTTYDCVANDITTRANPVQMISTSNSTATITNTTGASDVVNWVCVGQ
jgi:hypothetical protein